jgi:hypothetical protein
MNKYIAYDRGDWIVGQSPLVKRTDESLGEWLKKCGFDLTLSINYVFDKNESICIYKGLENSTSVDNYLAHISVLGSSHYVVLHGMPSYLMFIRDYANPIVIKSIYKDLNDFKAFIEKSITEG